MSIRILAGALAVLLASCLTAGTAGDDAIELTVGSPLQAGVEGALRCRPAVWFPLFLRAANRGETDRELAVSAVFHGLGGPCSPKFQTALSLPASSVKVFPLYVTAPDGATQVQVRLEAPFPRDVKTGPVKILPGSTSAILLIDPRGAAKGFFADAGFGSRDFLFFPVGSNNVPHRIEGFETFDWVVLGSTGSLTGPQVEAVTAWVRAGGNVLIYPAPDADPELSERLFPQAEKKTASVRPPSDGPFRTLEALPLALRRVRVEGVQVLQSLGGHPLLCRRSFGAGTVLYFAADPTKPPIREWTGRGRFLSPHLGVARRFVTGGRDAFCVSAFPGAGCDPASLPVGLFLALWAVAVGPLGFFVLRTIPSWRWGLLAFLLLGTVFIGTAGVWGGTAMDREPRTLVFAVLHSRDGAKDGLAEVYRATVRSAPADVELVSEYGELVAPVLVSSSGGGMTPVLDVGGKPLLRARRVDAGRPVLSRHLEATSCLPPGGRFVVDERGRLAAAVSNPTRLRFESTAVLFGRRAYEGKPLLPGKEDVRWFLESAGEEAPFLEMLGVVSEDPVRVWWLPEPPKNADKIVHRLPLPRGARYEPGVKRVIFRGMLAGSWTSEGGAPVTGADRGLLFCEVEGANPEGILHLPPGVLAPRWNTQEDVVGNRIRAAPSGKALGGAGAVFRPAPAPRARRLGRRIRGAQNLGGHGDSTVGLPVRLDGRELVRRGTGRPDVGSSGNGAGPLEGHERQGTEPDGHRRRSVRPGEVFTLTEQGHAEGIDVGKEAPPLLELRGLRKHIGPVILMRTVSFTLARGECLAVLGPSRSGKTHLLRATAGLAGLGAGQVLLDGAPLVPTRREVQRRIGLMPAPPRGPESEEMKTPLGVFPHTTVREDLEFFAACLRIPRRRWARLIDDVLALVDLSEAADQEASRLSPTRLGKLFFARVILHNPDLLLLDEPLPAFGEHPAEFWGIVEELKRMGKGVLLTSADPAGLANGPDRVVVLYGGLIVDSGPPAALLERVRAAGWPPPARMYGGFLTAGQVPAAGTPPRVKAGPRARSERTRREEAGPRNGDEEARGETARGEA
jgi:polar amino acid transport system ATP-binding protein